MFNVEIWLILKCNLQFQVFYSSRKTSPVQGTGAVSTLLLHHFLCQTQLAFKTYYCIDNANFKMMPSFSLWLKGLGKIPIIWINLALDGARPADISRTI